MQLLIYYNTLRHFVLWYGRPWDKLREKKEDKNRQK